MNIKLVVFVWENVTEPLFTFLQKLSMRNRNKRLRTYNPIATVIIICRNGKRS
ncbi:hypothetical protein D3C86_563810 [compost metagenome]